jgi:Holliday junction resolvase RusA-like endonuclease
MYTPKKTSDEEERIASIAKAAMTGMQPIAWPVSVSIQIRHGIRKSWTKIKQENARLNKIVPTIKSDMDNVIKLYFDALNGIAWIDDVQVVNVIASKRFAELPCVQMRIIPLDIGSA